MGTIVDTSKKNAELDVTVSKLQRGSYLAQADMENDSMQHRIESERKQILEIRTENQRLKEEKEAKLIQESNSRLEKQKIEEERIEEARQREVIQMEELRRISAEKELVNREIKLLLEMKQSMEDKEKQMKIQQDEWTRSKDSHPNQPHHIDTGSKHVEPRPQSTVSKRHEPLPESRECCSDDPSKRRRIETQSSSQISHDSNLDHTKIPYVDEQRCPLLPCVDSYRSIRFTSEKGYIKHVRKVHKAINPGTRKSPECTAKIILCKLCNERITGHFSSHGCFPKKEKLEKKKESCEERPFIVCLDMYHSFLITQFKNRGNAIPEIWLENFNESNK